MFRFLIAYVTIWMITPRRPFGLASVSPDEDAFCPVDHYRKYLRF